MARYVGCMKIFSQRVEPVSVSYGHHVRSPAIARDVLLLTGLALMLGCSSSLSASLPVASNDSRAVYQTGAATDEADTADKKADEKEETPGRQAYRNVETHEEKKARLDRKLDTTLREFDELVLREQKLVEESREADEASSSGGSGGGSEAGEGDSSSSAGNGQAGGAIGATGKSTATPGGDSGGGSPGAKQPGASRPSPAGTPAGGPRGRATTGRTPPDVGDGRDDDIVARQLREAAQNEESPELREKLWDEYRAYKRGTGGSNEENIN